MLSAEFDVETGRSECSFSRMTEHDLLEVVEIEEQTGLSRWGWGAYHTELLNGTGSLMLVARLRPGEFSESRERLAGFVASRLTGDELHINNIAVRTAFRRRGIGGRLLREVLREGAVRGGRTALLEVRLSNEAAIKLAEKYGFRVIARRSKYYTQPVEDALVMRSEIGLMEAAPAG
jgi:ribosomal-protein-alanine N-acetyltransferase